ncbi:NAD-dependent epimerase/dehydratase family protein [Pedobacter frigoris]|nr:NAD-dependent epimerase/dehydratase family protein [Pedobacter frigoris]
MINVNTTISILGCGWYGLPLAKKLVELRYNVKGSTTTSEKVFKLKESGIIPYIVDFQEESEHFDSDFFDTDLLIICIPPKRSTAEQGSFTKKITKIISASEQKVKNIIFISSTSVYGDYNTHMNEFSTPIPDSPSGKAMLAAETILKDNNYFKTTIIRFAGLIGPDRDPGRFFAGKTNIPNGLAPINLIILDDCINLILKIIELKAFGYIYNACIPDHPSKQSFYTKASENSGLAIPDFINELNQWKIIDSQNVPELLNYQYSISKWSDWLA